MNYVLAEDDATQTEEAHVAFAALLQDLLALRAEANKLWRVEYAKGPLHLSPVAVATNTGIDLARRLESEVTPLLDRVGGVGKLLARHYRTAVAAEGMTSPDDEDEFAVEACGISKGCMFEAYYLMEQVRRQCRRAGAGEVPPVYDGRYGWFDEGRALSVKSNQGIFDRDRAALFEVLSETAILVQKVKWNQAEDELTRGVRLILQSPDAPLPFWTILAAQLFIDNIDILSPTGGFDRVMCEITNIARCFAGRAKATLEYIEDRPRPVGWSTKKDGILRRIEQDAPFFETPVLARWKRRLSPDLDRSKTESVLMRRNGMLAGVWTHMQGDDKRFWVGSRPRDMSDFWKQWRLCHGASLTELAREPDGPGLGTALTATQRPRRGLVELAPASLLLRGRLGSDTTGKARVEMSLDGVRKILGDAE